MIVTGPTAVGKTAISLLLAQRLARQGGVPAGEPGAEAAGATGAGAEEGAGVGGADGSGAAGPAGDAGAGGCGGCEAAVLPYGGEVISADSVQVYRGLDVGSDKVRVG